MKVAGTNIISSLGFTTEENYDAVKQGNSGVRHYDASTFDLTESFMASLINKERLEDTFSTHFGIISPSNTYTALEKASILSIYLANREANIDLSSDRTIFVLSTTKGNADLLNSKDDNRVFLAHTANVITHFFANKNKALIISNACISGAAAQVMAMRALQSGRYDNAVVAGVDALSKFIISGFQSFKALSPDVCKPFDKERSGLNLGEAAACMIFSTKGKENSSSLVAGAIRNDANHISAPSRTGEGSFRALTNILQGIDRAQIAFINAHGTATPYNDAMEVNAILRAGLQTVPVNSLKAYFGHTLGAAGVLESIISLKALEENLLLKSLGFDEQDFEQKINISTENKASEGQYFLKMMSGFGGVNAALLFKKN
jgi:3-oxoacyl-[acyl-carrier-protein] synthase-1